MILRPKVSGEGAGKAFDGEKGQPITQKTCYHCGIPGHIWANCWELNPEQKKGTGKGGGKKGARAAEAPQSIGSLGIVQICAITPQKEPCGVCMSPALEQETCSRLGPECVLPCPPKPSKLQTCRQSPSLGKETCDSFGFVSPHKTYKETVLSRNTPQFSQKSRFRY